MAPMTAQRRFARIAGEDEDDSDLYDPRYPGRKGGNGLLGPQRIEVVAPEPHVAGRRGDDLGRLVHVVRAGGRKAVAFAEAGD